ncbi:hypothetical protein [Lentilactobacillus senioris]|uniref:hypothetical protein n=1 Tax=Lentilactobacillus senioris TaxID=931534 RepID=UPI003D2D331A
MSAWTHASGFIDFEGYTDLENIIGALSECPRGSEGPLQYQIYPIMRTENQCDRVHVAIYGYLRDFDKFDWYKITEWINDMPIRFGLDVSTDILGMYDSLGDFFDSKVKDAIIRIQEFNTLDKTMYCWSNKYKQWRISTDINE